jgi:S1-C subfamily serine protease
MLPRYMRSLVVASGAQRRVLALCPVQSLSTIRIRIGDKQQNGNAYSSNRSFAWAVGLSAAAAAISLAYQGPAAVCDEDRPLSRNFVADAIEIVAPAVVNIMCAVDSFMMTGISSGSGFLFTEDGFVVTNAHVVASSADGRVVCTMMDGKKVAGSVHSLDLLSDIALVKLDNTGVIYITAPVGSSGKVRVGEFVIAIGSPLQLQNSASFGIVSATARHASELGLANNRAEYIQTDAAINMVRPHST